MPSYTHLRAKCVRHQSLPDLKNTANLLGERTLANLRRVNRHARLRCATMDNALLRRHGQNRPRFAVLCRPSACLLVTLDLKRGGPACTRQTVGRKRMCFARWLLPYRATRTLHLFISVGICNTTILQVPVTPNIQADSCHVIFWTNHKTLRPES